MTYRLIISNRFCATKLIHRGTGAEIEMARMSISHGVDDRPLLNVSIPLWDVEIVQSDDDIEERPF